MQLEQEHIDHIQQQFAAMSTKDEFVEILNYAKKILFGKKAKPFELKQITFYANPKIAGQRYYGFEIRKKSGGIRKIHAPVRGLKVIQKCLNIILQCVFSPHKAATGFIPEKSIVDNAKVHAGRNYVYNIDLKDFFPSIDQARVWKCLQLAPFFLVDITPAFTISKEEQKQDNLKLLGNTMNDEDFLKIKEVIEKDSRFYKDKIYSRLQLAGLIANLCCTEMEVERWDDNSNVWKVVKTNVLPQGAPTSPILTNIVCQKLDFLLTGVAKRFGLKYTRYADDITFSAQHNVFQKDGVFVGELRRIISQQKFHIKESKVRLQAAGYRQEVTGLIVNNNVNVHRKYIKQLRMWLYNWERYGYDRSYGYFLPTYLANKTIPVKGKPDMANVIAGKLEFLKMVRGKDDACYLKLKERLDKLAPNHAASDDLSVTRILDIWENEGIDKAMKVFYEENSQQEANEDKDADVLGVVL